MAMATPAGLEPATYCLEGREWLVPAASLRCLEIEVSSFHQLHSGFLVVSGQLWISCATCDGIIPTRADHHALDALAQSRRPMDMMIQGWSMRRFHASQQ